MDQHKEIMIQKMREKHLQSLNSNALRESFKTQKVAKKREADKDLISGGDHLLETQND